MMIIRKIRNPYSIATVPLPPQDRIKKKDRFFKKKNFVDPYGRSTYAQFFLMIIIITP
jgi:hypothetical protein